MAGFLGVNIVWHDGDKIEITQLGLTRKIVEALGLTDYNPKSTPAVHFTLPTDEFGEECDGTFNYASVLGMLLYLQGHTRPDISFAVNQCARYTFRPTPISRRSLEAYCAIP